jgi:hypothetical protein
MDFNWLWAVSISTALVVIGEALALILGMYLLSRGENPWRTRTNNALIATDIIVGGVFLWSILAGWIEGLPFYLSLGLLIITHAYRIWENRTRKPNPFCANRPLIIVNNLKLTGLMLALLLVSLASTSA